MLPTPGSSEGSVVYYWADFLAFQTTRPNLRFLDSVKFISLCLYTFAAFKIYPCFLLSYSVLSLWVCLSLNNPFAALSVRRGEEGMTCPHSAVRSPQQPGCLLSSVAFPWARVWSWALSMHRQQSPMVPARWPAGHCSRPSVFSLVLMIPPSVTLPQSVLLQHHS